MISLSSMQKRFLRGKAHHINPVVMVGEKGLSANVLAEIDRALEHHELVKVRLRAGRDARQRLAGKISRHCGALLVQQIGQIICLYRRNASRPVLSLPDD